MNTEANETDRWVIRCQELTAERDRLAARVATLEKDAARYQFLRDYCDVSFRMYDKRDNVDGIDAAIDAALAAKVSPQAGERT